jgi:HD-GYP domain-containing protein (c-di-GMP phosphodiesterase class II)
MAYVAGLLHDIGKIAIPTGILEKPGPLTPDERKLIERHPAVGERILAKASGYEHIASIVRSHHERIDGLGYPDGLARDAIPTMARIIGAADAYNAMTSDRPYRPAMSAATARGRMWDGAGTQFDAEVVIALDAVLEREGEDYAAGIRSDLVREQLQTTDSAGSLQAAA